MAEPRPAHPDRRLWVLLGFTPDHGAPTTPVGVLGVDLTEDDAGGATTRRAIAWMPHEYGSAEAWQYRLADMDPETLPAALQHWALATATADALPVDPTRYAAELTTAVHQLLDDVLVTLAAADTPPAPARPGRRR